MLDFLHCLFILASLAIAYVLWFYLVYVPRYPPGPRPWPVLGNLPQMPAHDLPPFLDKLVAKYGPVFTLYLPKPNVVLASYETIKWGLADSVMLTREQTPIWVIFAQGLPNGGIVSANGEMWREQKRVALRILRDFGMGKALMEDRIIASLAELIDHIESIPDKSKLEMLIPLRLCIGNVINSVLFGKLFKHNDSGRFLYFVGIVNRFFKDFVSRSTAFYQAWPFLTRVPIINATYQRMNQEFGSFMEWVKEEVDEIRKEFDPAAPATNFTQAYLAEMHKQGEEYPHLCIEQLYRVASDCWIGGMETSSSTLGFALLYLAKYPEVQAKAYAEVERVVGRDRYVTMRDKDAMPYMEALINEVQRVPGIVEFTARMVESEQRVANFQIPANTAYLFYLLSIMKGPPFKDPEKFDPERFLAANAKELELPEHVVPFGMGRRKCLGEPLARMEIFLGLATLVQKYEFHPVDGQEVDLTPIYSEIIYSKPQPLRLVKRV